MEQSTLKAIKRRIMEEKQLYPEKGVLRIACITIMYIFHIYGLGEVVHEYEW